MNDTTGRPIRINGKTVGYIRHDTKAHHTERYRALLADCSSVIGYYSTSEEAYDALVDAHEESRNDDPRDDPALRVAGCAGGTWCRCPVSTPCIGSVLP